MNRKLLILSAALLVCMSSCKKIFDDLKPVPFPTDVLPEETQTGENRLGCLINGEVFASARYKTRASYGRFLNPKVKTLIVSGRTQQDEASIILYVDDPKLGDTLFISDCYYSYKNYYFIDTEHGKMYLTRFDTINRIVSGRFEFTPQRVDKYQRPYGDSIVYVTEGRFDIKY